MFMRGSLLRCVYAYSMFNKWPEAAPILRGLGPVAVLMDYIVFSAMCRRAVIDEQVDTVLKEVCLGISERYQLKFLEMGTDKDHVHFLVQSVPTYGVRLSRYCSRDHELGMSW